MGIWPHNDLQCLTDEHVSTLSFLDKSGINSRQRGDGRLRWPEQKIRTRNWKRMRATTGTSQLRCTRRTRSDIMRNKEKMALPCSRTAVSAIRTKQVAPTQGSQRTIQKLTLFPSSSDKHQNFYFISRILVVEIDHTHFLFCRAVMSADVCCLFVCLDLVLSRVCLWRRNKHKHKNIVH